MSAPAKGGSKGPSEIPLSPQGEPRRIPRVRPVSSTSGPSLASQLELNDVPEYANEPGPGHYFGPRSKGFSALGEQKFSKSASAPSATFHNGTGWEDWNKVFVTKHHETTLRGRESPGCAYEVQDLIGKTDGIIRGKDFPGTFGISNRPDLAISLGVAPPGGSPGPTYNLREVPGASIGDGISNKGVTKNGRGRNFGESRRFDNVSARSAIGPGDYPLKAQLNSGSGKSIGCGRSAYDKVCTPGWEDYGKCSASIGPGPPLKSEKPRGVSVVGTMSLAQRFPTPGGKSAAPGPIYNQSERAMSKYKQNLSDTRTPQQTHFGTKPKKPRYRQELAQRTSKNACWGYF